MRIVAISDTHNRLDKIKIPEGDVLVHAGDLTNRGTLNELVRAATVLRALPHKRKVIIAGNHDHGLEKQPREAEALFQGMDYLRDSGVTIDGIKFWGSPWQPEFCNWAFNLPRNGPELMAKWALIPSDTDVLVTHGPPYEILDLVPRGERVGCELLLKRVAEVRPKLHVFGHIHEGYGIVEKRWPCRRCGDSGFTGPRNYDGVCSECGGQSLQNPDRAGGKTIFANAATCDGQYRPVNAPLVIDL